MANPGDPSEAPVRAKTASAPHPARLASIEKQLARELASLPLGTPCQAFESIPSTMTIAHQLADEGAPEGACVWAQTQTAGKGRAGRVWTSPRGGVYLSLILKPLRPTSEIPQLALIAGLAAAEAIRDVAALSSLIRWPNDLLIEGKKVVGILVEASTSDRRPQTSDNSETRNPQPETRNSTYAVVGIGMNVETDPKDLPDGAASLRQWCQPAPNRIRLAAAWLRHLARLYAAWNADGFAAIRPELLPWIGLFGQLVHITTAKESYQGQAVDLDESGRLLIRLDSGVLRPIDMGEVTLLE